MNTHLPLSALGQRWQIAQHAWREGAALAQSTGLPLVVAHILASRGYADVNAATQFLNPRLESLPDPLELKSMAQAITRLQTAVEKQEAITIFGDYDVDGTCATALVVRYLRALGLNPGVYIPDRLTEGYGPTPEAMRKIAATGATLLITVDTGTTAHPALNEAASLGLDVIVTDHHQPESTLPPAIAILNPWRADDTSPLQGLCGSGIAFYMLMALNRSLRQSGFFTSRPEPRLSQMLDLVALATVADVMNLTGINRVLVAKGVQQLATWQHRGLASLAGVAGVRDDASSTSMAFALAPRLNAAGRIESAQSALNLLLAESEEQAFPLANQLNNLNAERQRIERAMLEEAARQAEDQLASGTPLALVLSGQGWHPGVAGIVAARIKERFNRATFVLGVDANNQLKGSGRSIPGLNLGLAVHACKAVLASGGGHAMAAGVTLGAENLPAFTRLLNEALWEQLNDRTEDAHLPLQLRLAPHLKLEAEVTPSALTPSLAAQLAQLGPFGAGNPEPVLAVHSARIVFARPVGATQEHLKLKIADISGTQTDAICFGCMNTPLGPLLTQSAGRSLTLAATLKGRIFNGKNLVDVHVKDAHENFAALTQPAAA